MNADSPTPEPLLPPAPDLPPATDAPAVPTAAPLTWPEWFRPFDTALAIVAVVLAFLLASFVARNSDLWRHLAAGRLVTQFQYPVGGDPFTYTAADRPWVNANWLGEVLLYVLHSLDSSGAVAVGVKAIAFAASIGLLFLLKKPGAPLWPWAAAAAAAAVAAGSFTQLRPQVFALPVMAGILAVLYTADWAKGHKWRMPAILGGLTAVWANLDSFAFLSPLMIGLMLAGDWLDAKFLGRTPPPDSGDDPFRGSPPRSALWRALLLCVVGVMLNPTFVGGLVRNPVEAVAQLVPFELDFATADVLKEDRDLYRYTYSVFHLGEPATIPDAEPGYLSNPILGANPSGVFAVVLWVVGLAAAGSTFARGLGHRHGRLSHLLVWLVPTLLAAVFHARFVPYSMLVAVPFIAAHLNGFGRWVPALAKLPEQLGRGVRLGCVAGRVLCMVGLIVLLLAALPGWLHPWNGTAAGRRYVDWKITPDDGLKRAGETFARWHADPARAEVLGRVRGLNSHPDLGDYLAYHAPQEKSFVTSRYRLHREELPAVVQLRQRLYLDWEKYYQEHETKLEEAFRANPITTEDGFDAVKKGVDERVKPPVEIGWLVPLADKHNIGYVSVAQAEAPTRLPSLDCVRAGFGVKPEELPLYGTPWHLDGRLMVVGRTRSLTPEELRRVNAADKTPEEKAEVERLVEQAWLTGRNKVMTWDVAREVFGPRTPPDAPPLPGEGRPPQQGWEIDMLTLLTILPRSPARPVGLDDADASAGYIDQLLKRRGKIEERTQLQWQVRAAGTMAVWRQGLEAVGGPTTAALSFAQMNGATLGLLPAPPPRPPAQPLSEQDVALPFLSARSARDGLAVDPNAAGGFVSLARAFSKPTMPATDTPTDLFPVGPLPSFGPSEAELQVMTALRRATDRLPPPGSEGDEYTTDALRARQELVRQYLQVGIPLPVVAYRQVGKTPAGQIQVQGFQVATVRVGYVDAARRTLNELNLVIEKLVPAKRDEAEQQKARDKLAEVANDLIPLWQMSIQLCEADFWQEFDRYLPSQRNPSGQVPPDWWGKIDTWLKNGRRDMTGLLVEADYLKKGDWTGWQDKYVKDLTDGKADPAVVLDRLQRLHQVLDRLVGRRMGRVPKASEDPAAAFYGYVQSGLLETALKMVETEGGVRGPDVRASYGDMIRLMVWVGRAEDAKVELDRKSKVVEEDVKISADGRALEQAKFRTIEFDLAKLNGNYSRADTLYAELLTTPMGPPPPLVLGTPLPNPNTPPPLTSLLFADLWRPTAYAPLTEAELTLLPQLLDLRLPAMAEQVLLTGGGVMMWANMTRDQLRRRLLYQAVTHYQRGVFALLGGDPARAREQFDKAADPQGVSEHQTLPPDASKEAKEALPVQRLGPTLPQLEFSFGKFLPKYRELLEKYDAK